MAAPPLRFFPRIAAPLLNGNGKAAHAPEAKAVVVDSRIFSSTFGAQFVPLNGKGETTRVAHLDWYAVSWLAYACMRYRATKLVEAPLWITEEDDGEESWVEGGHELAELLERPNPDMEMADLLELTSLYWDSTGAALWVKSRDRSGRVGALYPFSGDDFRVETADGRLFGRFRVKTKSGEQAFGPDDVVHFRYASPADPHGAVAPLHAALARLGIDRQLVASLAAGLRNAIVPGMMLEFDPEKMRLEPDQLEQYLAAAAAKYADARNHGKLFASNARARQGQLGFEGLAGGELAKEIEAAVCACFQLPPVVIGAFVGLTNSSDRHNLESSILLAYDNATIPTWARMEKVLTRQLLRPIDNNPLRFIRFDRSKVKALQDDRAGAAGIVKNAERALLVNDARALLGLPPLEDERGERLLLEGGPAQPGQAPEADPVKRGPVRLSTKAISDDDLRRAVYEESTRAAELGWVLEAGAQLDADRAAVLALAERTLRPGRKDDDPFAPADPETVRDLIREVVEHLDLESAIQWRRRAEPLVEATARRAVERVAAELGVSFDLLQPGLLDYTQREAAWLVKEISATTKQAIRDVLGAGLLEGESIPALTKRIQEAGAFARSRAELIARTETTRVTNGGQRESLEAYQRETGDRITKRWLATMDSRTRDAHAAMNGETRGIDEAFSNGLQHPGEPNCRCTLVYELSEAA